jgi:tripartite-type tricarboxylate transporter receptor subunit TctC
LAKAVAGRLSALWGQVVTVENFPGGGSTAAPKLVAAAPSDGYTLLINTCAHAYSAAVNRNLAYDPLADFAPVAALTRQAYVLVAPGFGTLDELIIQARARPGELTFTSTGVGTGTHLASEYLNVLLGTSTTHIPPDPDDDVAATIAKVADGARDYAVSPISIAAPHFRRGELVPLGVTASRRSPLLPDVPTIAEAGVAEYDFPVWYGLWAPAATPPAIAEQLATAVTTVLADPDLRDWLATHGAEPVSMTRTEFARFVRMENERAAQIVKNRGIALDSSSTNILEIEENDNNDDSDTNSDLHRVVTGQPDQEHTQLDKEHTEPAPSLLIDHGYVHSRRLSTAAVLDFARRVRAPRRLLRQPTGVVSCVELVVA